MDKSIEQRIEELEKKVAALEVQAQEQLGREIAFLDKEIESCEAYFKSKYATPEPNHVHDIENIPQMHLQQAMEEEHKRQYHEFLTYKKQQLKALKKTEVE